MFQLVKQRRVWWPVTFNLPADGGEVVEARLEMHFLVLDEEQLAGFTERASKVEIGTAATNIDSAADLVLDIAQDWRGVHLENEEPAPFNRDNLRELIKQPGAFMAVLNAYARCRNAAPEKREGN